MTVLTASSAMATISAVHKGLPYTATFIAMRAIRCRNGSADGASALLPPIEVPPDIRSSSRNGSVSGTGGCRTSFRGFGGMRFRFSSGVFVSFGVGWNATQP